MPEEVKRPMCPLCQTPLDALLFMGTTPDGWTCPKCNVYFPAKDNGLPADKPMARVF